MPASSASNGLHSDDLRYIPFAYDVEHSEASALHLIHSLQPEWEHEEGTVELTSFKDGITNTLMKATKRKPNASEEQLDQEAILLRAYGNGTEVLIDRERETASHSILAQHGLAPPLLARFENGLLYRFIRGQPCTSADLTKEPIWRGVAQRTAQWHALLPIVSDGRKAVVKDDVVVPLDQQMPATLEAKEKINAIAPTKPVPNIWTVMQKWILALPSGTKAEKAKKDALQKELDRSASELSNTRGLGGNGLVFGHCDLLSGNVIILPPKGDELDPKVAAVSFIDYEYATPSPAAFDLANHFSEWGGFECDYHALPTRSVRRAFLEEYITSYSSHTKLVPGINYVDRIYEEVDRFRGIPGLYWGIWALIQAKISQIDFDYASYAEVRLAEYLDWRAEEDGRREKQGLQKPLRERRWAEG